MRIPGYDDKAINRGRENKHREIVTPVFQDGVWVFNGKVYRLVNGVWDPVKSDKETKNSEVKHARNTRA